LPARGRGTRLAPNNARIGGVIAERRPERFELQVSDIDDPLPNATFGSIGRYVEVALPDRLDKPVVSGRLRLSFDEKRAQHVDLYTLTLFRVDLESRVFTPVESSRVDVGRCEVTAWVNTPGIYGLIGLPKHSGLLETLRLFDRFGPQLLEERERREHGLHNGICGLILCADPTQWGDAPTGPGDLCQKCLGLDISFGRLPEKYLLERRPDIPPLREIVDDPDPVGQPSLLAWGRNYYGQLGDGSSRNQRETPVWVVPRLTAKKVVGPALGEWTLALGTDGSVWSWGFNGSGQLGDGKFVAEQTIPVRVAFLTNVVDIAAGTNHGVAVKSDGSVWSWGLTDWRQPNPDRLPLRVIGLSDIVAVAAGYNFSLALRDDGRVFAWGDGSSGQLGDGSQAFRASPVQVSGLTAIRSIAAGIASSFAIKSNGALVAWGAGPLGVGGPGNRLTPVPVPGLSNIEQVSVAGHGLARTTAGAVWFWGHNPYGQAGDGTFSGVHSTPVQVPGLQMITGIAVGDSHSLAFQSDGTVWAWGSGSRGQVGVGSAADQPTPVAVALPGGLAAAGVGGGEHSSFAIVG
jgi:alpha-tubulin suppressor-like RCC1 family protein